MSGTLSAREVAEIIELSLTALEDGYARRRLVRRGLPIRTDTYLVGDHLIWGATARILGDLLDRINALRRRRGRSVNAQGGANPDHRVRLPRASRSRGSLIERGHAVRGTTRREAQLAGDRASRRGGRARRPGPDRDARTRARRRRRGRVPARLGAAAPTTSSKRCTGRASRCCSHAVLDSPARAFLYEAAGSVDGAAARPRRSRSWPDSASAHTSRSEP